MKFVRQAPFNNITTAANKNSTYIDTSQTLKLSAQVVTTGTVSGTVQLQVTNDASPQTYEFQDNTFTNWSNLGSAVTITMAGTQLIAQQDMCYRALRVVFTDSSGGTNTGTVTVQTMSLGI